MRKMLIGIPAALLAALMVVLPSSCGKKAAPPVTGPRASRTTPATQPGRNLTGLPLSLPDGFTMSFFAQDLGPARVITWDGAGNMLVSLTRDGRVVTLPDADRNGEADSVVTVAEGLVNPHGLAFSPADPTKLYIAETDQVAIWDYDQAAMTVSGKQKIIDLPGGGGHSTRTIIFMPPPNQGRLLISVGSSMNVGYEQDQRRAKILVANADGSDLRPFGSGLRNSVFMAVNPWTGAVWATEMGRDNLRDDIPPDEVNIIEDGKDYGWPTCYGKNVHDTDFDTATYPPGEDPCAGMTPSWIDIQAHSAPLGLAFFPRQGSPAGFEGDMLVCYHGSWNRSVPTGYKVVRFDLDTSGNLVGSEDFITGWLSADGNVFGRPTGVSFGPDGAIYIADDYAGAIYRLTYQ